MKRNIIIYLFISFFFATAYAQQDVFTPILSQIEQNNTTLEALRKQTEAQKAWYHTGLTPRDPELQLGYLLGKPSTIGARKDISIRQDFDFPSVYAQRNRLADMQSDASDWKYRNERMMLLLKAKQTCIQLIYCNALVELYEKQSERAKKMVNTYNQMLKQGSTNQLELDKARLHCTTTEGRLSSALLEQEQLLSELQAMNNGMPIELSTKNFELTILPNSFDNWMNEAEQMNPTIKYLHQEKAIAESSIKLTRASALPRFSIGYMGEFVAGNTFQGITVGLSIPLWENKNKINHARQTAIAAERKSEDARLQYRAHLRMLYDKAIQLQKTVAQYDMTLSSDCFELLTRAYECGELPLLNYLLEQDYWTTAIDCRLRTQRELAMTLAELNAWKL